MKLHGTALLGSPGTSGCCAPRLPRLRSCVPGGRAWVPEAAPGAPRSTPPAGGGHPGAGWGAPAAAGGAVARAAARVLGRLRERAGPARWAWPLLWLLRRSLPTGARRPCGAAPSPPPRVRAAGGGLGGLRGSRGHGGGPLTGRSRLHEAEERAAPKLGRRAPLLEAQLGVLAGREEEPQRHPAGPAPPGPAGRPVPGHHR